MKTIHIDDLMARSGVSFCTSGVRGLVAEMTDLVCYNYVTAFLQYVIELDSKPSDSDNFPSQRQVFLSGDLRPSTSQILQAAICAVQDRGFLPMNCGRCSTPVLALHSMKHRSPGIMVTGSHISEDRNGMKFFLPSGEILKNDEQGIRNQRVEQNPKLFDKNGALIPSQIMNHVAVDCHDDTVETYFSRYTQGFPQNCLDGLRIGLFEHSGVARDLLGKLYRSLGAHVVPLGRTDGFVAIDTEAVSPEFLKSAREWTKNGELDAVLSTDGDGDRPLIFDEKGEMVPGDIAGIITAKFLNADLVVTPVTSNTALEKSKLFRKIVRTQVGSPYVIEGMEQAKRDGAQSIVGYEANGGFMTATPFSLHDRFREMGFPSKNSSTISPLPTRDPVIVHLALLLTAKQLRMPFSGFHRLFPERVTKSDRLCDFPLLRTQEKFQELQNCQSGRFFALESEFQRFGRLTHVDLTDGIRMTFDETRIIHLRPSGNAPELRCYTEAAESHEAQNLLQETMQILETWR